MNIRLKSKRPLFIVGILAVSFLFTLASSGIVDAAVKKPGKVRTHSVQEVKKYGATFNWDKKARAKYYRVQLLDEDKNLLKEWSRNKKLKRIIKKKSGLLLPSASYGYRLKACNSAGCGKWSFKESFTTKSAETDVPAEIVSLEAETFDLINDYRVSKGLDRLTTNTAIAAIAREHSTNMASGAVAFGHDGFSDRFADMLTLIGGSGSGGENVAYATDRPELAQVIVDGWIASEGHRNNIEGAYVQSGMGIAFSGNRYYFTQLFLSK